MIIAVGSDAQWRACAEALELTELASDPALATNAGRLAQRTRVVESIANQLGALPASHWLERLAAAGVPCGLVRTVPEVLAGRAASATTGMPPSVPGTIRLPPPRLGQHTKLVRDQGWSAFAHLEGTGA
jgi:crotonobetainyl-CoA:carnitine CoA-transferase CaiB-like acyl-CoA transferase